MNGRYITILQATNKTRLDNMKSNSSAVDTQTYKRIIIGDSEWVFPLSVT